ncbi:acetaldehyde dehydrogenase (acetylating) [Bacillus cereus]|uniref:acetaldehyde dehydrogenase (acetylating) n=1 Tax=Bacillus nitratireducens TaxID=2026193 RepID=UPI00027925D8|nr:acetaldehyde dehydrogenase (acetylating) [Bacillus nitratireducens]EJQ09824.1 acetaldehyde dehydrogenase [Bacillus cereus BAG3X2-1]EJS55199.1 acetaldehyde dehydrogenase [Bacillus cereus BAG1X1-3]EOO79169.1 acetaldehyde dehydrogenase [Bacillus cereus BAG1O-1]EOP56345.1 acetaldehyde dehydrogenase [Bacillus cereus VDM053]OSY02103.1 Acetaldehyde dehydrogenase, acetylating [Bacillus mycoides]PDY23256.1 acetaldehyde dehydrogenase (acetylating) [Bacillus cereus]
MEKVKVAIIGSGNIGTDLMYKLRKSEVIELNAMIGIDSESDGLKRAKEAGYEIFDNGIQAIIDNPNLADIVFDATSAKAHSHHAKVLGELGKIIIDLTPAACGPFVCPAIPNNNFVEKQNVNMITCGGQATIPIVYAINEVANVTYAEIVATISSLSAGPGTRANIDEFTITTRRGIEEIGGADQGKALIILNPAEPPILMRDTVYCEVKYMDEASIQEAIQKMVEVVRTYVPGYSLKQEPMFDGNRVTVFLEVEGAGDYFPPYAGNLDIMTAASLKVAEEFAAQIISEKKRGVMNEAK